MSDADQSSAPLIPAAAARAGDADREAVADRLRIAAGDGRIDLAELDERLTQARITAESTTGFITIDFTRASCAHREVAVEAITRTGWIRLLLPDGWAARISPSSTNTSHISNKAPETAAPGSPTVIVTGHPLSGYIKIRQRHRKR